MQLSAFWASVRLITECIASLPLTVYRVDPATGIRKKDPTHPLNLLFGGKPNRWQTRLEFLETVIYQLVSMGNAYVTIQRDSKGKIFQLIPLMTQQMQVTLDENSNVLYKYTENGGIKIYSSQSIWHLKLFGNGIIGLSPLDYARNSIGVAQGAEAAVTSIYENGGKPSGVLTIDKILTDAQRDQIKKSFSGMTDGNNSRLFTLEAGMKFQQISLSPQDIELLASRRFQIEDIARFFGVPSVLINDTANSTVWGSGIQQIVEGFYKLCLNSYIKRIQDSMLCWLVPTNERLTTEIEFDFNELIQPFLAERIKTYKEAVTGAIITPNEARVIEGWNEKPGGDSLYMQQQMVPIDKLAEAEFTRGKSNETQSSKV